MQFFTVAENIVVLKQTMLLSSIVWHHISCESEAFGFCVITEPFIFEKGRWHMIAYIFSLIDIAEYDCWQT